jgi:hypothetical protein
MGLIKTAIMTGGGIYAVDKLAKTVQSNNNQNQNHHCACCSRNLGNQNNMSMAPRDLSRGGSPSQSQQQSQQGYWGPPPTQDNMVWYPYPPDSQQQGQQARSVGNKALPAQGQGQGEWEQHPYYRDENALRGTSSENLPAYGNGGAQKTGYAAEK